MSNIDIDPLFTSICSSKTLQSANDGFFNLFYQSVAENFIGKNENWLHDVFHELKSDSEKLKTIYEDPTVCFEVLGTLEHVQPVYRKKDATFSWQKREIAKKLMLEEKCNLALLTASQAVMRAPMLGVDAAIDQGCTLSLALWNRSEILIKLLDGKRGLKDLQLAAKCGMPIKQNAEYYGRLAKCYILCGENNRAAVASKLFLQFTGFNKQALEKLEEELKHLEKLKLAVDTDKKLPELFAGEHTSLKSASSMIDVVESIDDQAGRFIVAAEDVGPAQTLLVEKPVAACLYSKNFGTHCNACFERLVAPIGCPECSGVAFCSVECRDLACSSYHKFECKYLDLLIGSGMSILCHIALRFVTQSLTPEIALIEGKKLLASLCSHSQMREAEDYFQRTLMSGFILRCLQKSEFFGRRTTEAADPTPLEAEIGAVILGLLQALQFNAHEIYETKIDGPHRFDNSKVQYIGVGIYKTGALFNHECYPGITRNFLGTTMILHSSRPIKKNELVAENYGSHFLRQNLVERQRNLRSRYWFKCECKACQENWPVMKSLKNNPRLKCTTDGCGNVFNYPQNPEKGMKCWKCKQNISFKKHVDTLEKCTDIYSDAAEKMNAEKVDEAIDLFKEGISLFYDVAIPPHKQTHVAEESLRACLADKGSTYKV